MRGDTPTHRAVITEMSDESIDAMLLTMRDRRLSIVRAMQDAELAKRNVYIEHQREKLNKQLEMLKKELATVDKSLDKAEQRVLKIRALRLEIEG